MKEFMLYIRNTPNDKVNLSTEEQRIFQKKCEDYIAQLKGQKKLIAAQPLFKAGYMIRKVHGTWVEKSIENDSVVQVGYYHIRAVDMEDAITIAKQNPEFDYIASASIEVRPVKTKED
ncbi:MAG: hypothetical protein V4613_04385 [Bacteroidota bacterium]